MGGTIGQHRQDAVQSVIMNFLRLWNSLLDVFSGGYNFCAIRNGNFLLFIFFYLLRVDTKLPT